MFTFLSKHEIRKSSKPSVSNVTKPEWPWVYVAIGALGAFCFRHLYSQDREGHKFTIAHARQPPQLRLCGHVSVPHHGPFASFLPWLDLAKIGQFFLGR